MLVWNTVNVHLLLCVFILKIKSSVRHTAASVFVFRGVEGVFSLPPWTPPSILAGRLSCLSLLSTADSLVSAEVSRGGRLRLLGSFPASHTGFGQCAPCTAPPAPAVSHTHPMVVCRIVGSFSQLGQTARRWLSGTDAGGTSVWRPPVVGGRPAVFWISSGRRATLACWKRCLWVFSLDTHRAVCAFCYL